MTERHYSDEVKAVRERFEKWAKRRGYSIVTKLCGISRIYADSFTNYQWLAWRDSSLPDLCDECEGLGFHMVETGHMGDGYLQPPDGPMQVACEVCCGIGRVPH